eukprot:5741-Heterococcus_DN1.PRE.1
MTMSNATACNASIAAHTGDALQVAAFLTSSAIALRPLPPTSLSIGVTSPSFVLTNRLMSTEWN